MAFDGVSIACICKELSEQCTDGRIDKVLQPEKDEICLVIRANGKTHRLLASASSTNPRVHLTRHSKENPSAAPMFCMLLRKHLVGGKVLGFEQPEFERVLQMKVESHNEMGDVSTKTICVEIMSRHSNIILIDDEQRVLGSLKHVDFSVSSTRQVLPGMRYELPPGQDKHNPLTVDASVVSDCVKGFDGEADQMLLRCFTGIGPLTAREVVFQTFGTASVPLNSLADRQIETFTRNILAFFQQLQQGRFSPVLLYQNETVRDFSAIEIAQYQGALIQKRASSLNEAADAYFYAKDRQERMRQKTASLERLISNNIARCQKKIALQQQKLKDCQNKEQDRQFGDLIMSNLHRLREGEALAQLENFYDDGRPVTIPLDPQLSPSQNAQNYYRKYQKAKTAEQMTQKQMKLALQELEYLTSVKESLLLVEGEADVAEIRQELSEQGYLIRREKGKAKKRQATASPARFQLSDGFTLLVGKNNSQNDELTLRQSHRNDLWFHTKNIHGSHAVIRTEGRQPSEDVIVQAAKICAYYSKARDSANVPVDYTFIRHVKKPSGAKPGMVIYEKHQTVYVTPALPEE